jgi:hypothetical protein
MTREYLGEQTVPQADSPYAEYTPADWAMEFITRYGQTDGDHHKAWVLDQVARILKGTPVTISLATWSDGQSEYLINTADEPSAAYQAWVEEMLGEEDPMWGREYEYDVGTAP